MEEAFRGSVTDSTGVSRDRAHWPSVHGRPLPGCNDPITWLEVICVLQSTRRNKAPGIDGIPADIWKLAQDDMEMEHPLSCALITLVSGTYESGTIPDSWNEAVIVPIPKKRVLNQLDDYRGISLISTVCKILIKVIANRIYSMYVEHNLLRSAQAGFRRLESVCSSCNEFV